MIITIFGLPGHGKTTYLAKICKDYLKIKKHGFIYSNVNFAIPGIVYIDPTADLGVYEIFNGIVILDESSQLFDSRDFKHFGKEKVRWFNEHRHHHISRVFCAVQKYDSLDIKIRNCAERCYWVRAYFPHSPLSLTRVWKIPRSVLISKGADASKLTGGEIINGYVQPGLFARLFCTRFFGRKYWKLFNSFIVDVLPPLPEDRFQTKEDYENYLKTYKDYKASTELKNAEIKKQIDDLRPERKKSRKKTVS